MLRAHQMRCAALIGGYARTAEASGAGALHVGARSGGPAIGGAGPYPAGHRDRRQWLHAGTRRRRPHRATADDGARCRAGGAAGAAAGARPGAAQGLRARAGVRPLPHHRPVQALHGPDVATRTRPLRGGLPVVWQDRADPALRAVRFRRGARGRRRSPPHRRGTRPRVSRHRRDHLRRRRGGRIGARRPGARGRDPWRRTRRRGRLRGGAAARRLGAARQAGPAGGARTRCVGGWRPPRWSGIAATAASSRSSPSRSIPTVQALIRWDPVAHAESELDARAEVGLPPAVHMAAVDGPPDATAALLEAADLPDGAEVLGPVELPPGARRPAGGAPVTGAGDADAGAGASRSAAWRWRRRCAGPPACSVRATISSPFVCRSTRCT